MNLKTIIKFMNDYAPEDTAYDWDNVGLLLGQEDSKVNKILLTLDVTENVVAEAIDKKIDLIISHHPFIFKSINKVVDNNPQGRKIIKLIKNNINVYSSHTNLDLANDGTNDTLFDLLKLEERKNLQEEDENSLALGRVGTLKESLDYEEFIIIVKEILGLEKITYVKSNDKRIKKVAIATGSCGTMDFFIDSIKNDCDVLITSDIKHHDGIDANELGLNLIEGTHYGTEFIVMDSIYKKLMEFTKTNNYNDIEVVISKENKPIFKTL